MPLTAWFNVFMIVVGLVGLWRFGDWVVCSLVELARRFNISTFFLGFVILALAADIPELGLAIVSALQGASQVSVGDIIGANFTDIALVVGATLLLAGSRMTLLESDRKTLLMLLSLTTAILASIFWIGSLHRIHGVMLVALYGIVLWWLWRNREASELVHTDVEQNHDPERHPYPIAVLIGKIGVGIALVMGSSYLVVNYAVALATSWNVSLETIGATICGVGTSLPELALSLGAIRRGYYTLAIGPTLGTVLSQSTLILGILACLSKEPVQLAGVGHAAWFMFAALALIGFGLMRVGRIGRGMGAALISLFVTFLMYHVQ